MIEFKNVSKTFDLEDGHVRAVDDVSFTIKDKEIFGVIGHSGAGKSTLVRLINFLETPTSGEVHINQINLRTLPQKDLRKVRRKIGMIFQGFNLMQSRTIYDNVAFPLKNQGKTKDEIKKKVSSLLDLVGIADKSNAYPSQLSGGQKQRVAIARALANDPDILLCDEATSALDPKTTATILNLIKELNRKLEITVVIITHEMQVIKEICDRVCIMDQGRAAEVTTVLDLFSNPQTLIGKEFIASSSHHGSIQEILSRRTNSNEKIIRLEFLGSETQEATIGQISKRFDVDASILYAHTDIIQNELLGFMVIALSGERSDEAIAYLNQAHIKTEVIEDVHFA